MRDVIVRCACGQKNRIPTGWSAGQDLRCGKCKAFFADQDVCVAIDMAAEAEVQDLEGGQS